MINNKKLIAALMAGAMIFTGAGCNLVEKTQGAIDRQVVAKGNGIKIKRGDVDKDPNIVNLIKGLEEKYGKSYSENQEAVNQLVAYKKSVISNMVNKEILEDKFNEFKISMTEEEIQKKIEEKYENEKEVAGGQEEYDKLLEKYNITLEDMKKEYRTIVIADAVEAEVTKDVAVTDEEVEKYYKENGEKFTEQPNEVKVSYILVDTQEKADAIIKRLDNKESFADIAKEESLDEASKEKGGDLGYIKYDDPRLSQNLAIALKTIPVGNYQYMQDTRGFNIVKVEDKKDYPIKKFEDVKDDIKENLENTAKQNKWAETFASWSKEVDLKFYDAKMVN